MSGPDTMSVFYAYAAEVHDPTQHRYLLTFASEEIANQWWRAIQTIEKKGYEDIRRISSQMYQWDRKTFEADFQKAIEQNQPLYRFAGKVIYTLLPDKGSGDRPRLWALPPPLTREPISGQRYFIRSKAEPHLYWFKQDDSIRASEHARTAFRIHRADDRAAGSQDENVMIHDDTIRISLASSQGTYVSKGERSFLKVTGGPSDFKFGDFTSRFTTWDNATDGATNWSKVGDNSNPKEVKLYVLFSRDGGVGWELV